jgi:hypothetical protein
MIACIGPSCRVGLNTKPPRPLLPGFWWVASQALAQMPVRRYVFDMRDLTLRCVWFGRRKGCLEDV